jgi:hypothetical protein
MGGAALSRGRSPLRARYHAIATPTPYATSAPHHTPTRTVIPWRSPQYTASGGTNNISAPSNHRNRPTDTTKTP